MGWDSPDGAAVLALSLMPMAYIARLMRVSMLDTLGNDFIRTARAKGLPRRTVVWKHAFRNAFLPVFTYLGPATAYAVTGSFVVETVFNIPGLGQHFVNGVKNRDQTLILGTVLVYAAFLLTLNLLVDIGYALIDPRIEIAEKRHDLRFFAIAASPSGGAILCLSWARALFPCRGRCGRRRFLLRPAAAEFSLTSPQAAQAWIWFGTSKLGQSLLGQCLAGGVISLTIGLAAAAISVVLGVGSAFCRDIRAGGLIRC